MSPGIFSPLELAELSNSLPSLICETDIEQQVANIQKWLTPYLQLTATGFAISANGPEPNAVYGTNIQEDVFEAIEGRFAQGGDASGHGAIDGLLLVDVSDEVPIGVASTPGAASSILNGLAIRLKHKGTVFGTFFLVGDKERLMEFSFDGNRLQWFRSIFSSLLYNSYLHHQHQEKTRFFNLYETVSSSLCYAGDLQELLTTIISIVVSELPAEAGSILLYHDDTNELEFFSVMGETEDSLYQRRFPADKGIAGQALQEGVPVIVNHVQNCPQFFGDFDKSSGFVTRSILAAPVTAGEEKIGVIEAINKVGENSFDETDKRVLLAIADEVGLAIKNARMFDYVVNSYCKIRQGLMSCKGCVRPLKSWTPCARQLEAF